VSIYRYSPSSVIDEVTFRKTENGAVRAYIHASTIDKDVVEKIITTLEANGSKCIPYMFDNKPVLEVRGFGKESRLLAAIQPWVTGTPAIMQEPQDQMSWIDVIKKRSLQASGWLYSLGDIGFIGYGIKGASPLDVAAGVFYGLPTPVLMAYGRNDQTEFQIKDMAKKLADHMHDASTQLPPDCALESIVSDHKKGLIGNVGELLKRYPSEFMNLCYAAAGACIGVAAMKHLGLKPSAGAVDGWLAHLQKANPAATRALAEKMANKTWRAEQWLNAGVGGMTVSAGLFGTLVHEKAHDPDEPAKTGIAGAWDWMRQHPLTIAGAGLMVSTLLHAASTTVAMKGHDSKHKQAVWFRALFVGSALSAELMVAISSKGHGEGVVNDKSVDDSVIALAAEMIAKQPKEMQEYLTNYIGNFLGHPDGLAMSDVQVKQQLRTQVEQMQHNPWAQCAAPVEHTLPTKIAATGAPNMAWTGKIQNSAAVHTQPMAP